jgi:sterol desaturase/sphingolipid hydroxylase (fatty acid hydroxylase superfamily)
MANIVSYLESVWKLAVLKYPPGLLEMGLTSASQVVGFWIPCTLFLAFDLLFPTTSQRLKLQPAEKQPSWANIRHCIWTVFKGTALSTVAQGVLLYLTDFQFTMYRVSSELPSMYEYVWQLTVAVFLREILFYSFHRALHIKKIYSQEASSSLPQ